MHTVLICTVYIVVVVVGLHYCGVREAFVSVWVCWLG